MRTTRWVMVGIGLAFWAFAIVWPGMQFAILVLSGALVAFAVYGLMVDKPDNAEVADSVGQPAGQQDPPRSV